MGHVIDFENGGMASLRRRVAEVEGVNQDLLAFARGQTGAVAAIHEAVLAGMDAEGFDHLIHIVTQLWPQLLGLDAVALALCIEERGFRADASGLQFVDPHLLARAIAAVDGVALRRVDRGHPLFGPASDLIRAEALIRIEATGPLPHGLLALGQRHAPGFDLGHGSELLLFLGRSLSRMIARWLLPPI